MRIPSSRRSKRVPPLGCVLNGTVHASSSSPNHVRAPPADANDKGFDDGNDPKAINDNHERDVCIHHEPMLKFDESVNKENIIPSYEDKSNRVGCDGSKHELYSITNIDVTEAIERTKNVNALIENKEHCTEGSIKEIGHSFRTHGTIKRGAEEKIDDKESQLVIGEMDPPTNEDSDDLDNFPFFSQQIKLEKEIRAIPLPCNVVLDSSASSQRSCENNSRESLISDGERDEAVEIIEIKDPNKRLRHCRFHCTEHKFIADVSFNWMVTLCVCAQSFFSPHNFQIRSKCTEASWNPKLRPLVAEAKIINKLFCDLCYCYGKLTVSIVAKPSVLLILV